MRMGKTKGLLHLEALHAWLREVVEEEGRGDERYEWSGPVYSMMGKYIEERGTPADLYAYSDMPHYREIAETKPWTLGAALERVERLALPAPALALPAPMKETTHEVVPA